VIQHWHSPFVRIVLPSSLVLWLILLVKLLSNDRSQSCEVLVANVLELLVNTGCHKHFYSSLSCRNSSLYNWLQLSHGFLSGHCEVLGLRKGMAGPYSQSPCNNTNLLFDRYTPLFSGFLAKYLCGSCEGFVNMAPGLA
jgi:hypothetical protein